MPIWSTRKSWTAVAVSRVGGAHVEAEMPCQDASGYFLGSDTLIACVADGAGSARHSDRGSRAAVDEFVASSRSLLKDRDGRSLTGLAMQAFEASRLAVLDVADGDRREYATTLSAVIAVGDDLGVHPDRRHDCRDAETHILKGFEPALAACPRLVWKRHEPDVDIAQVLDFRVRGPAARHHFRAGHVGRSCAYDDQTKRVGAGKLCERRDETLEMLQRAMASGPSDRDGSVGARAVELRAIDLRIDRRWDHGDRVAQPGGVVSEVAVTYHDLTGPPADRRGLAWKFEIAQIAVGPALVAKEDGVVEIEDDRRAARSNAPLDERWSDDRGLTKDVDEIEMA